MCYGEGWRLDRLYCELPTSVASLARAKYVTGAYIWELAQLSEQALKVQVKLDRGKQVGEARDYLSRDHDPRMEL